MAHRKPCDGSPPARSARDEGLGRRPPRKLPVADGIARLFFGGWLGGRQGFRCQGHLIDHALEIVQTGDGNDDRVAFAARFFRDAQEPAPGIFLERDGEKLALDLNLGGLEGVLWWPGRLCVAGGVIILTWIRPAAVRRWTFVGVHRRVDGCMAGSLQKVPGLFKPWPPATGGRRCERSKFQLASQTFNLPSFPPVRALESSGTQKG